jgi:hypothetical protein
VKEGIAAPVADLKAHAELGSKPKSVQPIRGEVYRAGGQTGEKPGFNHIQELQQQAEPVYSKERIEEAREIWPDESLNMIIWRLKREDQRKEDEKHGRPRGFSF